MTSRDRRNSEPLFEAVRSESDEWAGATSHVTPEVAMAFTDGRLPTDRRDEVLDHIAACGACAEVLLDAIAGDADLVETRNDWRHRVSNELERSRRRSRAPGVGLLGRSLLDPASWPPWALRGVVAAGIAAGVALVAISRPPSDPTAIAPAAPMNDVPGTVGTERPRGAPSAATPPTPTGQLAWVELFPRDVVRSAEPAAETPATIRPESEWIAVMLHSTGHPPHPIYRVRLDDASGAVVWAGETTPSSPGVFVLGLPAAALPPGRYAIHLFGGRGGALTLLEEYAFVVAAN